MAKETKPLETLNGIAQALTERLERVTKEGLAALQDGADALGKATEAQVKTSFDLLKKSADTAKAAVEGDLAPKARDLVTAAFDSARQSADHWLRFAEGQLGNVRKVIDAAIESGKTA